VSAHHHFMAAISLLFATVFAIMIYSTIAHRRASGEGRGTRGAVQWFWAVLPMAILAGVGYALAELPPTSAAASAARFEVASVGDTVIPSQTATGEAANLTSAAQ
jgi:heme/copper-type cytochrome/quinol oxidase subunit 2